MTKEDIKKILATNFVDDEKVNWAVNPEKLASLLSEVIQTQEEDRKRIEDLEVALKLSAMGIREDKIKDIIEPKPEQKEKKQNIEKLREQQLGKLAMEVIENISMVIRGLEARGIESKMVSDLLKLYRISEKEIKSSK